MFIETLLRIPFSVIVCVSPSLAAGKMRQIQLSKEVTVLFYRITVHRRLPICIFRVKIAALASLKGVRVSEEGY